MKRLLFKKQANIPVVEEKPMPSLSLCILLDVIGSVFILVPFLGEAIDLIWAPISAFLFYRMFGGGARGFFGGAFSFLEEIIPGLNFIPTFTIAWFMQNAKRKKEEKITTIHIRPRTRLFGDYVK